MSRNVYSTDDLFAEEQTPLLTQNKSMPLDEMESGDGYGNNSMPCFFFFRFNFSSLIVIRSTNWKSIKYFFWCFCSLFIVYFWCNFI